MASSSRPSKENSGKGVKSAREANPGGWISDDDTRMRFVDGCVKIVLSPKY